MKTDRMNVAGMTCGGCVSNVKRALMTLPGVEDVSVTLESGEVDVRFDEAKVSTKAMREALQASGYPVTAAPSNSQRSGCCGA